MPAGTIRSGSLCPVSGDVYFQYLGYETVTRAITVGDGFQEINITLKTQWFNYARSHISALATEDPAIQRDAQSYREPGQIQ